MSIICAVIYRIEILSELHLKQTIVLHVPELVDSVTYFSNNMDLLVVFFILVGLYKVEVSTNKYWKR